MLNLSSPGQLYNDTRTNEVSIENINAKNTSVMGSIQPSSRPTLNFQDLEPSNENYSLEETIKKTTYQFKIILLGTIAVGKTAILTRYISNLFEEEHKCTLRVESKSKIINMNDKEQAKLNIWDTCGDEKFRAITRQYYNDANGILLVYDVTNRQSFDDIILWEKEIKNNAPENAVLILVGNKTDNKSKRVITNQEGKKIADELGIFFIEVSAKNGDNIHFLFEKVSEEMIQMIKKEPKLYEKESIKNLDNLLKNESNETQKKFGCC